MALTLATSLRTLFFVLACSFGAILIWTTLYAGGNPVRLEIYKPWLRAAVTEFEINIFTFALWMIYKESSYVYSAIWIFLMFWTGSLATCSYIFVQFFKLSSEESVTDPIYHVLLRHEHNLHRNPDRPRNLIRVIIYYSAF